MKLFFVLAALAMAVSVVKGYSDDYFSVIVSLKLIATDKL